jgi:hypothetical protein
MKGLPFPTDAEGSVVVVPAARTRGPWGITHGEGDIGGVSGPGCVAPKFKCPLSPK